MAFLSKLAKYCFVGGLLLALSLSVLLWYITTDSFQQMVRKRLVSAIETSTGGRAELGSFHVVPLRFVVEVRNLTIHGREAAGEIPLFHVDTMSAVVRLSSVFGAQIAFHSLTLHHPVVHVIFYPDGSTNEPRPKQTTPDLERLFSIGIDRLDVDDGELLWQDEPIPLQFVTNDISASLNYSFLRRHYSGEVSIGRAETRLEGLRPIAWGGHASFSIGNNASEIRSLTLNSEGSRLQLHGELTDFRNPTFQGSYELRLDLAKAGEIERATEIQSGSLEVKGAGYWSRQNFSSNGSFLLDSISWQDKQVSFKNASAAGNFSVDPIKISISKAQGRVFSGSFAGEGEVSNWQAPPQVTKQARTQEHGTVRVRTRDFSLSEILASMGPEFRPLNRLKFAGNVSGNSEVRWAGSIRNAEINASAEISKPSRVGAGQVPLTANLRGAYDLRSGALRLEDSSASTPATQLRATGGLLSGSSLRVSFATTDLREWQPVMAAVFPEGMPFKLDGRAAFTGKVSGKFPNLDIAGNLQVQDFETWLSEKTSAGQKEHWDSLATDLQLSPGSLFLHNTVLRNGNTTVRLDGNVGLTNWNAGPFDLIHLRVDAQNADAAQVAQLAGAHVSVTGQLNAKGELSGTISHPEAQGNFALSNGAVEGHAFDSATGFLQLQRSHAVFKDAHVVRGAAQLSGSGAYDFTGQTIQLNVTGSNFDLSEFSPLEKSRVRLGGKFDFSAEASGSTSEPQVSTHLHLRNVTLNEETAGNYFFDAATHGADLQITGHSDFKSAEMAIDGMVHLREFWPARVNLHFARQDVDSFIESYVHAHVTGHSAVAGDLLLEGPLRKPEQLKLSGSLTDFFADVDKVQLRNDGPLRFELTPQALKINSFHLLGENTQFSASGSVQFTGDRRIDLAGHGSIGLQLLPAYDPDFTASGSVQGNATLTGTLERPVLQGKLQIANASIADVNLPSALTEINGALLFNQNEVSIQDLSARVGGGTVTFGGHAELMGKQINFDLNASADAVRLRYPPGVSSTANAVVRWNGSSAGSLLSGDITVNKIGVTPGFDFGAYLEKSIEASSLPQTDPVLNNIRLDLHVVTAPELQMQTSVLRLRGEADLHVRGNAAKPVLLGRADIFEGQAFFGGTKYRLERGGVTFSNPAVTTPFLDLEATTRVRDYDITLSMTGPADKPKLNYRSEPPLPTSDIITLLAFGQTSETSAQLQQTNQSVFSQQASSAMLTAALNATLNNRTQRLFGNSSIKFDPQGLETETSPTQNGPAVTIEQQVRDNITVAYTTDVTQTSQQVIRAEYNVSKNVSIVAIRDQYGVVSFDVQIRRRKR